MAESFIKSLSEIVRVAHTFLYLLQCIIHVLYSVVIVSNLNHNVNIWCLQY